MTILLGGMNSRGLLTKGFGPVNTSPTVDRRYGTGLGTNARAGTGKATNTLAGTGRAPN